MEFYEREVDLNLSEREELHRELSTALPALDFPNPLNWGWGRAYGERKTTERPLDLILYYHLNIVALNTEMPEREKAIETLQTLGYKIAKKGFITPSIRQLPTSFARIYDGHLHEADKTIWEELRKEGDNREIITQLEKLLIPIVTTIPGARGFEFVVYTPVDNPASDFIGPDYVNYDEIIPVSLGTDIPQILAQKLKRLRTGQAIAISSRVTTKKETKHLPLIDFKSDVWLEDVVEQAKKLDLTERFFAESSEKAYHHYGSGRLLSRTRFLAELEKLAKNELVGECWPNLQAHQGFSLLRISPYAGKHSFPRILKTDEIFQ